MTIHIATDHRGFELKESLKPFISALGHTIVDHGSDSYNQSDDYPDTAYKAAKAVSTDPESRGIVLCGSGVGVSVVANKVLGVRCVLGFSNMQVVHARESDNCTMLALPADFVDRNTAEQLVTYFLETPFKGETEDVRRIEKVANIEREK